VSHSLSVLVIAYIRVDYLWLYSFIRIDDLSLCAATIKGHVHRESDTFWIGEVANKHHCPVAASYANQFVVTDITNGGENTTESCKNRTTTTTTRVYIKRNNGMMDHMVHMRK
jgi:hypothetical protein